MAATIKKMIKEGPFHADFQGIERSYYFTSILDVDPTPDAPIQIKSIAGFPIENVSGYMYDPLAICRKIEPRLIEGRVWECDFTYSTKPVGPRKGDPQQQIENPLNRPPLFRTSTQKVEWVMKVDFTGKPFATTAGRPYDVERRKRNRSLRVLEIQKNVSWPPPWNTWDSMLDHVNDTPFFGAPRGTVYFDSADDASKFENGIYYTEAAFKFVIDPFGWNESHWEMNEGSMELNYAGDLVHVLDDAGYATTEPAYLDSKGAHIDTTQAGWQSLIVINEFQRWQYADFSALNVGGS
jgi:hypothetical protein